MKRHYPLDYLRGLTAFGIMIYHYLSWSIGEFSSHTFLGRLGIYGVSIFYVLSGLTLYIVYYNKMLATKRDVFLFAKKRIFRIYPLLWLVTLLPIISARKISSWQGLALNLSGLFGFVKWDGYYAVGAWSIGNELVFYTFFPLFIFLTKHFKPLMIVLSSYLFVCYLYFAFIKLNSNMSINDVQQWRNYINPLNQIFLFLGGYLLGLFFHKTAIKIHINVSLLILGLAIFIFYPVMGDIINIVTGVNRLVFTSICFIICFSFYKLTIKLPATFHKTLSLLGEASYSIYLLHPIVYKITSLALLFFSNHIVQCPEFVKVPLAILATLIVSYFVYQYFEKYFMRKA